MLQAVLVCCLLSVAVAGVAASPDDPRIVEVYPDTANEGNAGEYVVVAVPENTSLAGWTLADGETTTTLTDDTVSGRVAFSRDPNLTRQLVDAPVVKLPERFALAQAGETVQLRREGRVVDETTYESATEGERWLRTDDGWEWRPRGATTFESRPRSAEAATAFVLPDSPEFPLETLRGADDRILLAGYTFSSDAAAAELEAAADRGVDVEVLVDGTPVGGQTVAEADALDSLVAADVPVRVFDGPMTRYRFHHAKYAVVDDRVLVLTENWKPAGTGGHSSRGWGVAIESEPLAADLAAVFEADASWEDTVAWETYREDQEFVESEPAEGSYPSRFDPEPVDPGSVQLVTAPDNAEQEVISLLEGAEESIRIEQVRIGDRDHPFLKAAIDAAERGVDVRILLDSGRHVEAENRELVDWINRRAEADGLPIEARLVDSRGNFEKIHAKGVVVDDRRAFVGSINWNNNSVRANREVGVVLEGEAAATYYASVFDADWRDGKRPFPVGVGLGVAAAGGGAALVARRLIAFD